MWLYAIGGVAGTPWFMLNNVDLAVSPSIRLSFEDWQEILDPLFPEMVIIIKHANFIPWP